MAAIQPEALEEGHRVTLTLQDDTVITGAVVHNDAGIANVKIEEDGTFDFKFVSYGDIATCVEAAG